jgi:hypothetical protein
MTFKDREERYRGYSACVLYFQFNLPIQTLNTQFFKNSKIVAKSKS